MAKQKEETYDVRIGDGTGLINPNSEDFRLLRESIVAEASQVSDEEKRRLRIKGLLYRMESYLEEENPDRLIPAGAFLKQLVEAAGVSHKDFAAYIGYKHANLSALYHGNRRMNHDLALKISHIFTMSPLLWLNLQNKVELLAIHQESEEQYQQYQLNDLLKKVS